MCREAESRSLLPCSEAAASKVSVAGFLCPSQQLHESSNIWLWLFFWGCGWCSIFTTQEWSHGCRIFLEVKHCRTEQIDFANMIFILTLVKYRPFDRVWLRMLPHSTTLRRHSPFVLLISVCQWMQGDSQETHDLTRCYFYNILSCTDAIDFHNFSPLLGKP